MKLALSLLLSVLLVAVRAQAAKPQPDETAENVAVDFAPSAAEPAWFVAALEELVRREFSRFERVQVVDKVDASACPRRQTRCLLDRYREQGVRVIVLGTLRKTTLEYETYASDPAPAFEGKLRTMGATSATLQRRVGDIVRPVVHHGGLLDRVPETPFLAEASGGGTAPAPSFLLLVLIGIALQALVLAPILVLWLLLGRKIHEVPRPASWALQVALVAALAVGLFVLLLPSGIGHRDLTLLVPVAGGILWGLYGLVSLGVVLVPMHGLERVRHDALVSLLRPWIALTCLRATILSVQLPVLSTALLVCRALGASQRVSVLVVLPAAGLLTWLWLLILCDNLAAYLDAKRVVGPATADNPWHRTIRKYFMGYVRRSGVEVDRRLLNRTLFLPSALPHVTSYGGGLGRPRILVGDYSREAALGELPDETEAPERTVNPEELPYGIICPRPPVSPRKARKLDAKRHALTLALPRSRGAAPRLIGEQATLLGCVMPHAHGIPLIANTRDDYDLVRQLLTEHYAGFRNVDDDDYDDTDPSQLDFLFGAILRELGAFQRGDGAFLTLRQCASLARPKASWLSRHILGGLAVAFERLVAGPAATVGDAYAALNHGLHHLIQYLYTLREERLLPLLTARADEPGLIVNSRQIFEEVADPEQASSLSPMTQRRLLWLSRLFHASLIEPRKSKLRWVGPLAFALAGSCLLFQAVRAAIHYHPSYVQRMTQGAPSDERTRTR